MGQGEISGDGLQIRFTKQDLGSLKGVRGVQKRVGHGKQALRNGASCISSSFQPHIVEMDHDKCRVNRDARNKTKDEVHQRRRIFAAAVAMEVGYLCLRSLNASASARRHEDLDRKVCAEWEGANRHCDLGN